VKAHQGQPNEFSEPVVFISVVVSILIAIFIVAPMIPGIVSKIIVGFFYIVISIILFLVFATVYISNTTVLPKLDISAPSNQQKVPILKN